MALYNPAVGAQTYGSGPQSILPAPIGSSYCVPNGTQLTVSCQVTLKSGDVYTINDSQGQQLFDATKGSGKHAWLRRQRVLRDPSGNTLAYLKPKITGGKLAAGTLDPVAGKATQAIVSSVKDGGKVLIYGVLGSKDFTSTVNVFDLGRVEISLWAQFQLTEKKTPGPASIAAAVSKLLEDKVFEPLSGKKFKFEEFKEALAESERPGRGGKVFLTR